MNEKVKGCDRGVETRVMHLRPEQMDHLAKLRTDKSFMSWISANSIRRPRIQEQDILDVKLEETGWDKLPLRLVIRLARGHLDLGAFLLRHTGCKVEVDPAADHLVMRCGNHDEELGLSLESLVKNPDR